MPSSELYEELRQIAQMEFADVVTMAEIVQLDSGVPRKLRLRIVDSSYADIFVSNSGRYSYHWERFTDNVKTIYRHDNAPHNRWKHVMNHRKHCATSAASSIISCAAKPDEAINNDQWFIHE